MDVYNKTYQNLLLLDDFHATMNEKYLVNLYFKRAYYLIIKSTCFKNPEKLIWIGLILRNQPSCFKYSKIFETGLFNFHLLILTEFKMGT